MPLHPSDQYQSCNLSLQPDHPRLAFRHLIHLHANDRLPLRRLTSDHICRVIQRKTYFQPVNDQGGTAHVFVACLPIVVRFSTSQADGFCLVFNNQNSLGRQGIAQLCCQETTSAMVLAVYLDTSSM
jgi:hypothetical protein